MVIDRYFAMGVP